MASSKAVVDEFKASNNNSGYNHPSTRGKTTYQSTGNSLRQPQSLTNSDASTLKIVNQFKKVIQNKVQQGVTLREPIVELDVVKIKEQFEPNQYDIDQWKENLPHHLRHCSNSVLRVSMAYGNNPQQVESVIETKMNHLTVKDSMESNYSIDNIVEPLKNLKQDLDRNPMRNLLFAVRNIKDPNPDRAVRLFLSEAYHFTPALRDYGFENAHRTVLGILDTNYETNRPQELLVIIKTMDETDHVRDYLNELSQRCTVKSLPTQPLSSDECNVRQTHSTAHQLACPSGLSQASRRHGSMSNISPDLNQRSTVSDRKILLNFYDLAVLPRIPSEISVDRKSNNQTPPSQAVTLPYPTQFFFPNQIPELPKSSFGFYASPIESPNNVTQLNSSRDNGKGLQFQDSSPKLRASSRDRRDSPPLQSPVNTLFSPRRFTSRSERQNENFSRQGSQTNIFSPPIAPTQTLAQFTNVHSCGTRPATRDRTQNNYLSRDDGKK